MKKTVTDHNSEILRNFIQRNQNSTGFTLVQASKLNEAYLIDHNPRMKKDLMDGIQFFIISIVQMMNINFGEQTIVDLDDIISYLNVYFAIGIENGLFIGAKSFDDIIPEEFRDQVYEYTFDGLKNNNLPLSAANNEQADDPYATVENKKFIGDFLKRLDEEEILSTRDRYEKFFFGDKAKIKGDGKLRIADFFDTNTLSEGLLKRVVRELPMFDQEREAAAEILADARLRRELITPEEKPKKLELKKNSK